MELRSIATGGVFEVDDVLGEKLLKDGGYERNRRRVHPAPATASVEDPAEHITEVPAAPKRTRKPRTP